MDRFEEYAGDMLTVDDDAEAGHRLRTILEHSGWTVSEAGDGQQALDVVLHAPPKLILLDLMMPVMDGFTFLHELRQRPGYSDIPVVLLSTRILDAEDRKLLEGADRILTKGETSMRALEKEIRTVAQVKQD